MSEGDNPADDTVTIGKEWKVRNAPMIPVPAVEEPFARIAMDIVGSLLRRAGNRYMLRVDEILDWLGRA